MIVLLHTTHADVISVELSIFILVIPYKFLDAV